jgi:transposase
LARQRYSGHKPAGELLAKLRSAPEGRTADEETTSRRQVVLALVATLTPLAEQIRQLDRQIAAAVRAHPDGEIFLSLFKDSTLTAAVMVAEIGDCRARYPSRDALAGDAGQAAVAIESGKRKAACFRWACNKRLRSAFCTLSETTRHLHPWAADQYQAARARGHDHQRAIRTLGRAWCRIVWRCWQDRTPYDPARHRALQEDCTVTIPTSSGSLPDLAATQRMLGATVTQQGGRTAEREALDGKPTSAIALGG